jgi:hypothetical protein
VKDVIASYEALLNLFERIQFFLQHLYHYTAVPLTPEMTEFTCEDHGPDPLYTCTFRQDNERDANQLVYSINIPFLG